MQYVMSKHHKEMKDMTYRIFITDELFYLNNNVVNISGGTKLQTRFADLVIPRKEETRTSDDIINHIKTKLKEL